MADTLVIQSHQQPLPYPWLIQCIDSVIDWCRKHEYIHRFIDNELFNPVPKWLLEKTRNQRVIATDLARLYVLQSALIEGYKTVIWLDADFLIFDSHNFKLPNQPFAVGREVWVQPDKHGKLRAYIKVHNAFLMFRNDNNFLDFYIDSALRLVSLNSGTMPPQFIGPKFLTAIHNIAVLPVMETAGMLSPCVIHDIVNGTGLALDLFKANSPQPIAGANLCISSLQKKAVSVRNLEHVITMLLATHNL